jgi:ankyrin repeat protein
MLLSDARVDVNAANAVGETALHLAADEYGATSTVAELLIADERVDLHALNENGETPSIIARRRNNPHFLELIKQREEGP